MFSSPLFPNFQPRQVCILVNPVLQDSIVCVTTSDLLRPFEVVNLYCVSSLGSFLNGVTELTGNEVKF